MYDIPDAELLKQFARSESEEAFAELVRRHIALVHSIALRHTDNSQHAQEITQAVFIILARKATSLGRKTVLGGWLHHTARLTAANFRRAEFRRVCREQEAFMQSTLEENPSNNVWQELSPLLDEAMSHLGATDRDAVVLRFFENKSLAEVGTVLGLEERAAQKRVNRALEKLRKLFGKRGVTLSAALIAGAVSASSVQAAPAGLAATISTVALTKGAAAGGSTLALVKGALKIMAWTKAKTAAVIGASVLLAAGTATVAVKTIHSHRVQPDIQGAWEGVVQTPPGAKLRLVLKVTGTNNVYQVSMDSIDQRVKDIPVSKFMCDSPALNFEIRAVSGTFEGKLNPAATEMSGTWKQPQLTVPLTLRRTASPVTIPELLTEKDYTPHAGSDLQGYWKGATKIGNGSIQVVFKFSEPTAGQFVAELDSPDQGANNIVISAVTYDKPTVHVEIGSVGGVFEGDMSSGRTEIKGTWSQAGTTLPLTIRRADPHADRAQATAQEAKKDYSYTSPNDLTGHWKGTLDVKGMKLHLGLHVGKLPNGSLAGSLDSLDQGANGIPANTVSFTAPEAHLAWATIGGTFDGKLENGKLSGKWRQGGQTFPLVFERDTTD